jgi:fructokinase
VRDEVLSIGEALVDIVERRDGARAEHPGGSPANVAIGLSRLGRHATLLTRIGTDERGRAVRAHLEESGVELLPGSVTDSVTSTATASIDEAGVASYVFDLDWDIPTTIDLSSVAALHTGSIAAFLEPGGDAVLDVVERASGQVTVSYDPNARPMLMGDATSARTRVERFVALADVVKVSDEDLAWLASGEEPGVVAQQWLETGPAVVVVTLGGAGSFGVCAAGRADVAAPPVTVVDTVGAGDSFMSGLLDHLAGAALLGGDRRADLRRLGTDDVEAMLLHAARIAAITCSRAGANPPTRAELDAWTAPVT